MASSRLGYLKLVAFGQEPNWNTLSFAASWSRSRLGYLKFVACGFVVRIPVGIPQVVASPSRSRLGYVKCCGFVPVGYLKFVDSQSRSRSGLMKFLWLRSKDPGRDTSSFVASSRLIPQVGGIAVKMLVGIPQGLWLRSQNTPPALKFVASWSRSRLGYLKISGFAVKIPVGTPQVCGSCSCRTPVGAPQVLWHRIQDPGWDTSTFVASQARIRVSYLKFCGFAVKIPAQIPQALWLAVKIPFGMPQVLWLRGQDSGWSASSLWRRGQDPGWHT